MNIVILRVDLITQKATKWLMCGEHIQCGEAKQKDDSHPGWEELNNMKFHHTSQNCKEFKIY